MAAQKIAKGGAQEMSKGQKEIEARKSRHEQIVLAEKRLVIQRTLMGKGKRKRIGTDEFGNILYKWAPERQK